jgi:hypothetical protein
VPELTKDRRGFYNDESGLDGYEEQFRRSSSIRATNTSGSVTRPPARRRVTTSADIIEEYTDMRRTTTAAVPTSLRPKTYIPQQVKVKTEEPVVSYRKRPAPRWKIKVVGGMCATLFLFFAFAHVSCWFANMEQSSYYTQSAHRDEISITTPDGQHERIKAFIDNQGKLSALIILDDPTKARTVGGTMFLTHPQDAMLEASIDEHGQVVITAVYPTVVNFLSTGPEEIGIQWSTNIHVQQGRK